MIERKPTVIVLICFYCFVLALAFLSIIANAIFTDEKILSSAYLWLPVGASGILTLSLVGVGIGILNLNQLCWKILFFGLMICVSSVASFFLVAIILLLLNMSMIYDFFNMLQHTAVMWSAFLAIFLSQIIVLYYHTREDTVSHFGEMGSIIVEPF